MDRRWLTSGSFGTHRLFKTTAWAEGSWPLTHMRCPMCTEPGGQTVACLRLIRDEPSVQDHCWAEGGGSSVGVSAKKCSGRIAIRRRKTLRKHSVSVSVSAACGWEVLEKLRLNIAASQVSSLCPCPSLYFVNPDSSSLTHPSKPIRTYCRVVSTTECLLSLFLRLMAIQPLLFLALTPTLVGL